MDLIERRAAIIAVKDALLAWSSMPEWRDDKIVKVVVDLPSVQPEERTEERTETHACDCISRQAALNEIAEWMLEYGALNEKRERDALQHVARGIKKLPSVQSKPDEKDHQEQGDLAEFVAKTSETCADAVSRQAAIDALEKVADLFPYRVPGNRDSYDRYNDAWNDAIGRAEIEIEKLPSAQPERTKGEWIPQDNNKVNGMTSTAVYYEPKCSVCGHCANYTNFCPDCGADMRGKQNETD